MMNPNPYQPGGQTVTSSRAKFEPVVYDAAEFNGHATSSLRTSSLSTPEREAGGDLSVHFRSISYVPAAVLL